MVVLVSLICIRVSSWAWMRHRAATTMYQVRIYNDFRRANLWIRLLAACFIFVMLGALLGGIDTELGMSLTEAAGRFVTVLVLIVFAWLIARRRLQMAGDDGVVWYFVCALGLYVAANVIGALIGIPNEYVEIRDYTLSDKSFGILDKKFLIPFAANHRSFAIEAGLLASTALAFFAKENGHKRALMAMLVMLGIAGVLMVNTRAAIIGILVVGLFVVAWKRAKVLMPLFVAAIFLFPMVMVFGDGAMPVDWVGAYGEHLSRGGGVDEIATLNNRTMIWRHLFEDMGAFKSIHLFGYGAFGHSTSGLSHQYGWMWPEPGKVMLHNTVLQYLCDFGYFGLAIYVLLILLVLKKLIANKNEKLMMDPSLAGLCFLLVCGVFEVVVYYTSLVTLLYFYLVVFLVATSTGDRWRTKSAAG